MEDESSAEELWWPPWRWNLQQWIWVSGFGFYLTIVAWGLTPGFIDWLGSLE